MYTLLIALSVAGALFSALCFLLNLHWAWSLILALIVGVAVVMLVSRKLMKRLEPMFLQAQKQAQARNVKVAIKTLESILPLGKWQIMLTSQINSQIGIFHYADKNIELALKHLKKGSVRSVEGQLIQASVYYKQKEYDKVNDILDAAIKYNKKQVLLYSAYAFMLKNSGNYDKAITILQLGVKNNGDNEATKDNLLRLQNNKKINMKPFGMSWYGLQLEKPPLSMMQDKFAGRAGFRQKRVKGR